jgi:hypothetical protein
MSGKSDLLTDELEEPSDINIKSESTTESNDSIKKTDIKQITISATTGIDIDTKIGTHHSNNHNNTELNKNNISDPTEKLETDSESNTTYYNRSSIEDTNSNNNDINNGWNNEAETTIQNWYELFKESSYVYQYILDKNYKISDRLLIASIVSSSILGLFGAFKLWLNDELFQIISNIILMILNFGVAILTALSKRFTDVKRNESIRIYIESVDKFLGKIAAQILKEPKYRMNADEFIKKNNDIYTKLISSAPCLSINEVKISRKFYKKFIKVNNL